MRDCYSLIKNTNEGKIMLNEATTIRVFLVEDDPDIQKAFGSIIKNYIEKSEMEVDLHAFSAFDEAKKAAESAFSLDQPYDMYFFDNHLNDSDPKKVGGIIAKLVHEMHNATGTRGNVILFGHTSDKEGEGYEAMLESVDKIPSEKTSDDMIAAMIPKFAKNFSKIYNEKKRSNVITKLIERIEGFLIGN